MLSAQKTRSGVPTEQQSVLPTVRGVPWWGAVLVALVPTAIGAIIDTSGSEELGTTYRVLYFVGCVAAVLAVRRRSLFTAVTQPPLVAFAVAVVALYLAKSDSASDLKSLIINVLLPIAKSFPLMATTFLVVLALGLGRWFLTRRLADEAPKRSARRPDRGSARPTASRTRPSTGDEPGTRTRAGSRTGAPRRDEVAESPADRPRRREAPTRHSTGRDGGPRAPRRTSDEPTRVPPPSRRRVDTPPAREPIRSTSPRERDEPPRDQRPRPPGHRRSADRPPESSGREQPPGRLQPRRPRPEPLDDLRPPSAPRARYRGVNP